MIKSRLCIKTKLCELIESLDQDECQQAINFLGQQCCSNLQNLLIKLLFAHDSNGQEFLTNESLSRLEEYVTNINHDTLKQSSNPIKHDVIQTADGGELNSNQQPSQSEARNNALLHDNFTPNANKLSNSVFPLMKLPIQMLKSICYFIKRNDILIFEQTCRVFYQLINNISFLKTYNGFKKLIITKENLMKIAKGNCACNNCNNCNNCNDVKYDLFKWSKCKHLLFNSKFKFDPDRAANNYNPCEYNYGHDEEALYSYQFNDFAMCCQKSLETIFDLCQNNHYYSNWIIDVFKSIETLTFNHDSRVLLLYVPVEIVLNESKSNLKQLEIYVASNNECCYYDYAYRNLAVELGRKISQFQVVQVNNDHEVFIDHDIKVLKCVELMVNESLMDSLLILQVIKTSKLCLQLCKNELQSMVNIYLENDNLYKHLTSLSIKLINGTHEDSWFYEKEPTKRQEHHISNQQQITQLELIGHSSQYIEFIDCHNNDPKNNSFVLPNETIDRLNLQNSLTHLMMKIDVASQRSYYSYQDGCDAQKQFKKVFLKMILSLIKKEYFYYLNDIKIWFILDPRFDNDEKSSFIDWIFDTIWSKCQKIFKSTSLKKVEIFAKHDSQTVSIIHSPANSNKRINHDNEKSQWKDKLLNLTTDES